MNKLEKAGALICYCDTDSITMLYPAGKPLPFQPSGILGGLTAQYEDKLIYGVFLAPKFYYLMSENEKRHVLKAKGVKQQINTQKLLTKSVLLDIAKGTDTVCRVSQFKQFICTGVQAKGVYFKNSFKLLTGKDAKNQKLLGNSALCYGFTMKLANRKLILLHGQSMVGKSSFVYKQLLAPDTFVEPINSVHIVYKHVNDEWFPKLRQLYGERLFLHENNLPEAAYDRDSDFFDADKQDIVVYDDGLSNLDANMVTLATELIHHKGIVCFMLLQTIYVLNNVHYLTIRRNSSYRLFFSTFQDAQSVRKTFASIFGGKNAEIVYNIWQHHVTSNPYSPLVLNMQPGFPAELRISAQLATNNIKQDMYLLDAAHNKNFKQNEVNGRVELDLDPNW